MVSKHGAKILRRSVLSTNAKPSPGNTGRNMPEEGRQMCSHRTLFGWSIIAATGFVFAACGDSDSVAVEPDAQVGPLGTVRGTLNVQDAAEFGPEVSVALLWEPDSVQLESIPLLPPENPITCTGEPTDDHRVQERTFDRTAWVGPVASFESSFPLRFEIIVGEPPPVAAQESLQGFGMYAYASLVVFIDSNNNGALDRPSADQAGDEILAVPPDIKLIFMNPNPGVDVTLTIGGTENILPAGLSYITGEKVSPTWAGVDIELPATLAERKEAEHRTCTSVSFRDEVGASVPTNLDPALTYCSEDGLLWRQSTAREIDVDRTCVFHRRVIESCLDPDEAIPEQWPCN